MRSLWWIFVAVLCFGTLVSACTDPQDSTQGTVTPSDGSATTAEGERPTTAPTDAAPSNSSIDVASDSEPTPMPANYTVQAGDSLSVICGNQAPHMSVESCIVQTAQMNNLADAGHLFVGQVLLLPIAGGQPEPPLPVSGERALVTRVIDGDTIELEGGARVRYIGMDTPETTGDCYSQEATARNAALVLNQVVELEKDVSETDQYGRLLRYVYVGGTMVNEVLVEEGYAQVSTYPPDVKYVDRFLAAQRSAVGAGRGLWSGCQGPTPTQPPVVVVPQTPQQSEPAAACPQGCTSPPQGCVIKGNISQSSSEKIYHVPGGGSYEATVISPSYGERWFCTDQEAVANGWRKARN